MLSDLAPRGAMDLHTGVPWWLDVNPRFADFAPLETDARCDVAIVGAGVAGALLALALTERGRSVVVLDQRDAGRGSTAASTALLMVETDAPMFELEERFGAPAAERVWRLGEGAIDAIEQLAGRLSVDIQFARRPALQLATNRRGVRLLEREFAARQAAGFEEVEFWDRQHLARLSTLPHRAALRSCGAVVDPFRLTVSALMEAARLGAMVRDRTRVLGFEEHSSGVRLETDRGPRVEARALVIAAGYESGRILRLDLGRLRSSYALVTEPIPEPIPGWPEEAIVWETGHPYLYARPVAGTRLLAGGEDSPFAGDHRAERRLRKRAERIARELAGWLPEAHIEVAHAWAGTFGESDDALPWIGAVPGSERVYSALGFGGNGITFAAIASELLADALCGRPSHDLELFAFDR